MNKQNKHPAWSLVKDLLFTDIEPVKVVSPRVIYQDITWEGYEWGSHVPLDTLGFCPENKLRQLRRNYYNSEAIGEFMAKLLKRKRLAFTSLSLSLRGEQKDSRSQGWCMNELTIRRANGKLSGTLTYRSTEVLQKFAADLAFLEWMFAEHDIHLEYLTFFFSNCYLSGVFLPSLFMHGDSIEFLKLLKFHNRPLFNIYCPYFYKRYHDSSIIPTYSPARRQHRMVWRDNPEMVARTCKWIATQFPASKLKMAVRDDNLED